jgi:hypothetical protein
MNPSFEGSPATALRQYARRAVNLSAGTSGRREVWPLAGAVEAALGMVLLATLYLAASDYGAALGVGELLHEVLHDGRHVLGMPCH